MKQLHKQSISNQRTRDEESPTSHHQTLPYSPKSLKHPSNSSPKFIITRSINYILKEQRLLFILIGILIGSTFILIKPTLTITQNPTSPISRNQQISTDLFRPVTRTTGRIPVGITGKRRRVVVTGGSGFVGSHLVDKLINRGDDVIVIDNFFTGRKENVAHHFRNPRFELIRHDVVEPILLEVDQIYHLACPASPVHYKYNPVKTIISFFL